MQVKIHSRTMMPVNFAFTYSARIASGEEHECINTSEMDNVEHRFVSGRSGVM